jgi:hypothetical protein
VRLDVLFEIQANAIAVSSGADAGCEYDNVRHAEEIYLKVFVSVNFSDIY